MLELKLKKNCKLGIEFKVEKKNSHQDEIIPESLIEKVGLKP